MRTLIRNTLPFLIFLLPLAPTDGSAQGRSNYVRTRTWLSGQHDKIESCEFYDALGRPTVAATNSLSSDGKFSYSLREYTGENLVSREWLPVTGGETLERPDTGQVKSGSLAQYADGNAFIDRQYDALGRMTGQVRAGARWKTKGGSKVTYLTNSAGEVKRFKCGRGESLAPTPAGSYPAGSLRAESVEDEDGNRLTTYTDAFNRKILERRGSDNDTYFVYDDFGRLCFVLTPEYNRHPDADKFLYRYTYDLRGNLTRKRLPGCQAVDYSYDANDRCVSVQDGELRKKGLYRIFLYDKLGRPVIQGLSTRKPSAAESVPLEFKAGCGGLSGTDYTSTATSSIGAAFKQLEIVTYYDDYGFKGGTAKNLFAGLTFPNQPAKGEVTGMLVATTNGQKTATVNAYDNRGLLESVQTRGLDGRTETTDYIYSYTNKLLVLRQKASGPKLGNLETVQENQYDPKTDRLRSSAIRVSVNGKTAGGRKTEYAYDRLGRLSSVSRPITAPDKGAIAYGYNIQGWLKSMESGSFCEELHYNEGQGKHLYGGNISSMAWRRRGEAGDRGYKLYYDNLGRLTGAEFAEDGLASVSRKYDERLSYDANGNPLSIRRSGLRQDGTFGLIDDLALSYDGNQLSSVEEKAAPVLPAATLDLMRGSSDFAYNDNGALTMDGTRGITSIAYDDNGNPAGIQFANGSATDYVYTAAGQKLRTIYHTAMPSVQVGSGGAFGGTSRPCLSADSIDYLFGGTVLCRNGRVSQILFDGGYVEVGYGRPRAGAGSLEALIITNRRTAPNASAALQPGGATDTLTLAFKYFNKDHLGNIREVIEEDGTVEQVTDYYPFGLPMSDLSRNSGLQRFKYNGKEFDEMHGLNTYDYGARQYNPVLARWDRMDPLAEKCYNFSGYCYTFDNPIGFIDPSGEDGVRIVDDETKTITIKADYFVVTASQAYRDGEDQEELKGFRVKDIKKMNRYNKYLNNLHLVVQTGEYEGYSILFDLKFEDAGSVLNATILANEDTYQGHSIGNTIQLGNEKTHGHLNFKTIYNDDGTTSTVGGLTDRNKAIIMNKSMDSKMNRIHEIFHTLGFSHPKGTGGTQGVMEYPPRKPSENDAFELSTNQFLPTIKKK
ncbi:MAG: RHS repeat-associated core domain-containing protein [Prevotella sp.]|nr:RHS repeat-associated core domain-containing protein [Prevotella sp.]